MATASTTSKLADKMPPWAVGVLVVSAIAAVGLTGYIVYKKIKNAKATRESKKEVGDIEDDLKKLQKEGKKISLSGSQISGIANALFTAFDGYGTNFDAVLKALVKVNNEADLLAVIKAYGVREVSSGRLNPEPNFKGSLGQTLVEELSAAELTAVNGMLAKKGIRHKF